MPLPSRRRRNHFMSWIRVGRLQRSTDSGGSWIDLDVQSKLSGAGQTLGGGLAAPFDLWLGSNSGLFKSTDAGQHWSLVTSFKPEVGVTVDFSGIPTPCGLAASPTLIAASSAAPMAAPVGGRPGVGITASQLAATILIHPTYQNMLFAYLWQDMGGVGFIRPRPTARHFQPDQQPYSGDAIQRPRRAGSGDPRRQWQPLGRRRQRPTPI